MQSLIWLDVQHGKRASEWRSGVMAGLNVKDVTKP